MKRFCLLICLMALASFATVGCNPGANNAKAPATNDHGHDHSHEHKHIESLPAFLSALTEVYTEVKTAMEKGDNDAAHGPLHEVAELLDMEKGDLPGVLKNSGLSADAQGKIKETVDKIFDEFGKLDTFFHGGPKVEWADLDKNLAPAMEELKGLIK